MDMTFFLFVRLWPTEEGEEQWLYCLPCGVPLPQNLAELERYQSERMSPVQFFGQSGFTPEQVVDAFPGCQGIAEMLSEEEKKSLSGWDNPRLDPGMPMRKGDLGRLSEMIGFEIVYCYTAEDGRALVYPDPALL